MGFDYFQFEDIIIKKQGSEEGIDVNENQLNLILFWCFFISQQCDKKSQSEEEQFWFLQFCCGVEVVYELFLVNIDEYLVSVFKGVVVMCGFVLVGVKNCLIEDIQEILNS